MHKFKKLSSLDKVFLNEEPKESCNIVDAIFKNETLSFQIAYYSEETDGSGFPKVKVIVEDDFGGCIRLRSVGNVPSELPSYPSGDADYITTKPGLFPDPLYNIPDGIIMLVPFQWRSIWVDFEPKERLLAGNYIISVKFEREDGIELACVRHSIEVINAKLPKQDLIHTEWMHYDCIGSHYGVEMLSEAHWELIERYMGTAFEHGINMILTPLFTPPLDTRPGGERPTVQLVGVKVLNGKYTFDFSRLKRFIDMCLRIGIEYFEMSHLFTQWGATAAPKIVAEVDGVEKRIFGWDTEAAGTRYSEFLQSFLPELTKILKLWNIDGKCFFHVSDEPNMSHLESYRAASDIVSRHLPGFNIIDALSDYAFYEKGLIKTPIPGSNHIEPFINAKVENLWTYYCCGQYQEVSNRFMSMPSRRNRIIATQFYKFNIAGFLQWGFNFWFSQYSIRKINPYAVTDAGNAFPSGDAFMVYPGEDGYPVESIRLKVFREALFDLRAMKLLESLTSREFVMGIIEEGLDKPISFSVYPRNEQYITSMRNRINKEIKDRL